MYCQSVFKGKKAKIFNKSALLSISLVISLIVAVIPIVLLGQYAHTCMDDYSYGTHTAIALRENSSLFHAILYTIKRYYFGWQGTFSASVMMSIVPSIWNENYYILTPIVMLASLFIGTFKLSTTIFHKVFKRPLSEAITVSSILLLFSIEQLPSATQAFYWWNGAVYYTFTYGIVLLLIDRLILLSITHKHTIYLSTTAILCTVFIGGNNFVSALFSLEICALFFIFCLFKCKKILPISIALLMTMTTSFFISVLAPGNSVRQSAYETLNPIEAIVQAILQAIRDMPLFTTIALVIVALLSIPYLVKLVSQIDYSFSHPIIVQGFIFLLYASQNTPHFYAMGDAGPGRLRNIVYYSFLWFVFFSEFYWCGYFQKHKNFDFKFFKYCIPILLFMLLFNIIHLSRNYYITTSEAILAINDGTAEKFDQEVTERIQIYLDPEIQDVYVSRIDPCPHLLFWFENSTDPNDWMNIAIKNFYGKNSVQLIENDSEQ